MNKKGTRKSIYLPERQAKWVNEIAAINGRSDSYIIQLAIEKLVELTGGYGDGEEE